MAESEPASEGLLSQDDINAALAAAGLSQETVDTNEPEAAVAPEVSGVDAAAAVPAGSGTATAIDDSPSIHPFDLPELNPGAAGRSSAQGIDLLRDVELNVKIELGRSRMLVEEVLRLGEGSVVELDKLAGDPVDVFVNNRLVAHGEVLVLNDNFCVRINEIVSRHGDEEWA